MLAPSYSFFGWELQVTLLRMSPTMDNLSLPPPHAAVVLLLCGVRGLQWGQLLRLELHYEDAHEAIAAAHGPYYYLSFIGTAPEARGKGLGSKLLQEMTNRADREGRWCLLEATSEKSEVSFSAELWAFGY